MSLIINHNISALNTQRNLGLTSKHLAKSLEKLSSGYKINVAADDPSGLIISEQLRSQTNGLQRAVRNSQEASNVIGIAEGALIEMNEILRKLRSLALHAANTGVTAPDQVRADQAEVDSSIQTIDRIANTTRYSDQFLLNGSKSLVYDRFTTVDDTMDHNLLDVEATRVDQIFKREGVSVTLAFSGVLDTTQADFEKQARRAYLEADNANADAEINGTVLTARQEFFVTGTRGSRLFNFASGTTLGTMVDSISNVKESTGVDATLIFASDMDPEAMTTANATLTGAVRTVNSIEVYGADLNSALPKVGAVSAPDVANMRAGLNTDGHGRVYAKVITGGATSDVEWYKDKDCTMLIGTGDDTGFQAANNSGIAAGGLLITTTANAVADDVYTVALAGHQGFTTTASKWDVSGLDGWTNISAASCAITGVELGDNTGIDGQLYFRSQTVGANRVVEAFTDSQMLQDSLVASGTIATATVGAGAHQIRLEAVTPTGETTDTNLNITLSFGAAGEIVSEETGILTYNNLGIRLYSLEYGSQEYVRVQNKEGQFWHEYNSGDNTTIEMLEVGGTVQATGSDAEISLNGAPLDTQGLVANVTTPDFQGALTFEQGELGVARIAQVGYEVGGFFSKATALQAIVEPLTGATSLAGATAAYTWATNARHQTTERLTNFIGGMQYQLGAGEGDQERTVYGIQSMASANVGRTEIDGEVYTLQDVLAGGRSNLMNEPIIALRVVTQAVNDVSELRARLGAFQKNTLQTNINALEVSIENIVKTESAIRDANMAEETTEFTKNQILMQAGTAMLAQANTASQNILQLLG